jgi:hypothetical protein
MFSLVFLLVANWMVMNSGTVKEAYVLLLAMNCAGAATLLFSRTDDKFAKLGLAVAAQLVFLLIAAPVWMTFLHTLQNSWTAYDRGVYQIQPSLFVGLFDDIFYRQFNAEEMHLDPSANFLVLGAVAWFCLSPNRQGGTRLTWGIVITLIVSLVMVFGVIPASVIIQLPFIGRIYHIDNTFSAVAIICLLLLAGFGIKTFWNDCRTGAFRKTLLRLGILVACLIGLYLGTTEAAQRSTRTLFHMSEHIEKSPFFWGYSLSLIAALFLAAWIGRRSVAGPGRRWQVLGLAIAFVLLHWRHGMHVRTPFDPYVMNPQPRTDLIADSSPAVKLISGSSQEPSRVVGLDYDFAPGYGGAIGLEQIDSADPLVNRHYTELINSYGAELFFAGPNRGHVSDRLNQDLALFNMLNVRYYLSHPGSKAETIPSLKRIAPLDLEVYESNKVWPRAFFADQLISYQTEANFASLLKDGDGTPFAAVAENDLKKHEDLDRVNRSKFPSKETHVVKATDYILTSNKTSFKIRAPGPGVVVLTEPYIADEFQLRVNGMPSTYFRVNSAFRGVMVPRAGDYDFSFTYWPRHFTVSLWISAAGMILLVIGLALAGWRTRART